MPGLEPCPGSAWSKCGAMLATRDHGSSAPGPFSFWRRVPVEWAPEDVAFSTTSEPPPLFALRDPSDFARALALDLLAFPPAAPGTDSPLTCAACQPSVPDATLATLGPLHFVQCMHGMRLESTCHRPVVEVLATLFSAALGREHVLADLGGASSAALTQWMQGPGAGVVWP